MRVVVSYRLYIALEYGGVSNVEADQAGVCLQKKKGVRDCSFAWDTIAPTVISSSVNCLPRRYGPPFEAHSSSNLSNPL